MKSSSQGSLTDGQTEVEQWKIIVATELTRAARTVYRRGPKRGHGIRITDFWPAGLETYPHPEITSQRTIVAERIEISPTIVRGISLALYYTEDKTELGCGLYVAEKKILITCEAKKLIDFYCQPYVSLGQLSEAARGLEYVYNQLKGIC